MTCEKVKVEHDKKFSTVSIKIGHDPVARWVGVMLNRLEAEGLRQRLIPPEAVQRRLVGEGDNEAYQRVCFWRPGQVLSDGDVRDLKIILRELNDEISDGANIYHAGRVDAYREIGGEELVAAALAPQESMVKVAVAKAMKLFDEKSKKYEAEERAVDASAEATSS